ncbi:sensor histidine kinase [Cohnella silvisoli]|uniref:Histidine kinase n=1 Tax=Cohnella silvisoli TaxID=2873699 RepID=A0ABV1KRR9_9BACL|nr:histidine kinase [Cohnella silvisoli]MCD9022500.1 histidine kinase [Cohnella silvisoli]
MQTGSLFQSTYTRMVVTLLVAVIPFYLIVLQINRSDAEGVRQGVSDSISSQAHYYLSSLEAELSQVIKFQQQLAANTDLDTLSNASEIMTNEDKRKAVLSIQQQLIQLKYMSQYIANTTAYLPDLGKMITANQTYQDISKAEYDALGHFIVPATAPLRALGDRLFICYSNPNLFGVTTPSFVLTIEIDRSRLSAALEQFKYNGAGITALLGSDNRWQVIASGSETPAAGLLLGAHEEGNETSGISTLRSESGDYLHYYEKSSFLGATFAVLVPEKEVFGKLKLNRDRIRYVSLFSLLIIAAVSYVIYRVIHHPLRKFIVAFRQVGNGNFNVSIERSSKDEFAYLYRHFNQTVRKLQELVYEVYEQKYRTQHAELKQLQSQINPHFLYNSFFTIYRMAKFGEVDNVAQFTKYLGEYYRFITRDGAEEVSVLDETVHARTYTEIQLFRFHDRISVRFGDIPEGLANLTIPRLTLQPVIENAFVHALEDRAEGGYLEVQYSLNENCAVVTVEDNGGRLDDSALEMLQRRLHASQQSGETTGMTNVHRRLQLRFGEEAGLKLSRSPFGGLKVEIVIPVAPNW